MNYQYQESYRGYDIEKNTIQNYYTILNDKKEELCKKETLNKIKIGIDFETTLNGAESIMF